MMQVMFGACLRVSETIGLTWSDVDMKNREIHVGGQLVYYEGDEGYCFHDSETKTDAGIRDIPMTQNKAWTSDHAGGSEQLSEKYCQCL